MSTQLAAERGGASTEALRQLAESSLRRHEAQGSSLFFTGRSVAEDQVGGERGGDWGEGQVEGQEGRGTGTGGPLPGSTVWVFSWLERAGQAWMHGSVYRANVKCSAVPM